MSLPVTQNILSCFDDLITLDGCSNVPSSSGFTMGDIGITKHEIDQYINKEYQSANALFEAKKTFSINLIANQIHNHLQPRYKGTTLVDGKRVGFIADNKQTQANTGTNWVGQEFNLKNNSSFIELFISEVSLFTNYTGDIEVRIYDLKTGNILKDPSGNDYSFTITTVGDEVSTVYPQIKIQSAKKELDIVIVYNATGITPYKVSTIEQGCSGCNPCNRTRYSDVYGITIPNASGIIKQSLSYTGYTGGMSVVYSINCSPNQWLCSVSNIIALPCLYKIASEIMDYALNSDQMNPKTFAQFNFEKLKERKDEYEFKYREALDNVLKNITIPNDPTCFFCQQKVLHTVMIP